MRGARVAVAGASDGVWAKSQYTVAPVPMEMKRAFCRRVLLSGFMGFGVGLGLAVGRRGLVSCDGYHCCSKAVLQK